MTFYFAFDTIRRSDVAYTHASCDNRGVVRFHLSREAARRRSWNIAQTVIATADQIAADGAMKRAAAAARLERTAEFDRRWAGL